MHRHKRWDIQRPSCGKFQGDKHVCSWALAALTFKQVDMYVIHVQDIVSFLWLTTHPIGSHTGEGQLAQWRMGPWNGAMHSQISFNENPVVLVSNSYLHFVSLSTSYLYLILFASQGHIQILGMFEHVYHFIFEIFDLFHLPYFIPFSTCFFHSSTPCFLSHTSKEPTKKLTAMPCLTTSVLSASTDHLASHAAPLAEKNMDLFIHTIGSPLNKMTCCGKASTTTCDTLE